MPTNLLIASVIEGTLLLCGVFFLWRCALSPAARAKAGGEQPLPFWDIPGYTFGFTALRVICVALGVQILTSALIKRLHPDLSLTEGYGLFVNSMVFQSSILLGVAVGWWLLKPSRFVAELNASTSDGPPPPPRLPWSRVPFAGFATFTIILCVVTVVSLAWQWVLSQMGRPATSQDAAKLFEQADSIPYVLLLLLLAAVVASLMEELVFRGGIFRYLRGRLPRVVAFLLPSILFAALHDNLIVVALPLGIFGVIQCFAYERTGRIAVPIIAHGLFNLHTAVLILADIDPYSFLQPAPGP